jgi:hypothetical protein
MPPERAPGWTEADLAELGPGEHDFREYKESAFLDRGGEVAGDFLASLSKQVSAFGNGGGGVLILGVDDRGRVDGGVRTSLKSGGVRAWLEDVIPNCVDPPLPAFNVFEVLPASDASSILPGHAVYVLELPSSDAAPHQALDHRYYLRIAGKSRPMGHVHVQDVLRRTRTPRVALTNLGPFGDPEPDPDDPRGPRVLLSLRAFVRNEGRSLARHVGGELVLPRPCVNTIARERMLSYDGVRLTQSPGDLTFFKYLGTPLFPTQETFFQRVWIAVHQGNLALLERGRAELRHRVYADDAPPREGTVALWSFPVVRRAARWVQRQARAKKPA